MSGMSSAVVVATLFSSTYCEFKAQHLVTSGVSFPTRCDS